MGQHRPKEKLAIIVAHCLLTVLLLSVTAGAPAAPAESADTLPATEAVAAAEPATQGDAVTSPMGVLSPDQQQRVAEAIDRALGWIASRQQSRGSFPTLDTGQPGVTSLCVLAFLSRGHIPGEGPHGEELEKTVQFVLSCQKPDGLITYLAPRSRMSPHDQSHTAIYNHAISALMLSEVYGMTVKSDSSKIRGAVERAVAFTTGLQRTPKDDKIDKGGWRYVADWYGKNSDLSVTSWQLLFLRSAKNAGFDVPVENIDDAMRYVNRCFDSQKGTFLYGLLGGGRHSTRAMAGAGILSLSLGGYHDTDMARAAGDWILRRPFDQYPTGSNNRPGGRYFYEAFYCSQAMMQLGGRHWQEFYPGLARVMVDNQTRKGAWGPEPGEDERYGNVYTTALTVLALSTPYQILPIYQR